MSIYTAPDKATLEKFSADLFAEYKAEVSSLGYTVLPEGIVGKRASDGKDVPDAALVTNWIEVPSVKIDPGTGLETPIDFDKDGFEMMEKQLSADKVAIAAAKNINVIKKKEAIPI